ncbi:LGFP repeat-containing protein [Brevibacterium sp. CS2]
MHWTQSTGAHFTQGRIQRAWRTQGYERGRLGYPTSDEYSSGANKRQNYEGGYILWSSKAGARIFYS